MKKGIRARYIISFLLIFAVIFSNASFFVSAEGDDYFFLGDVSGDGLITAKDARLALRIAAWMDPKPESGSREFKAADVDGDGEISSADARIILRDAARIGTPIKQTSNPELIKTSKEDIIRFMYNAINKEKDLRERPFIREEEGNVLSASVNIPVGLRIIAGITSKDIKAMQDDLIQNGSTSTIRDYSNADKWQLGNYYYYHFPIEWQSEGMNGLEDTDDLKLNLNMIKSAKTERQEDGNYLYTITLANETVNVPKVGEHSPVQHALIFGEQDYVSIRNGFPSTQGMDLDELKITYKDSYVQYTFSPAAKLLSAKYFLKLDTAIKISLLGSNIEMKTTTTLTQTYTFKDE